MKYGIQGNVRFGEMSVQGNVIRGTVRQGNFFVALSVGEKTVREKSIGKMSVEELSGFPKNIPLFSQCTLYYIFTAFLESYVGTSMSLHPFVC